jgi:hypothetical protein
MGMSVQYVDYLIILIYQNSAQSKVEKGKLLCTSLK